MNNRNIIYIYICFNATCHAFILRESRIDAKPDGMQSLLLTLAPLAPIILPSAGGFPFPPQTDPSRPRPAGGVALHEAAVPIAGVGPRSAWTDMGRYDLDPESIAGNWTANLIPGTLDDPERIALGCRDSRSLFVDTLRVSVPRPPPGAEGGGLGIELQELAGGREDGLGITVVTGLIPGGAAEAAVSFTAAGEGRGKDVIRPGDSIASLSVSRVVAVAAKGGAGPAVREAEETVKVETECLSYDATVDAILSLPPPASGGDELVLTLRRIRRKPKVTVNLLYPPSQEDARDNSSIELFAGENLRMGMLARGVKLNDPLAARFDTKTGGNCGAGGLCRTCAVDVVRGGELMNAQRPAERQMLQDSPRWRLACKAFVGYGMSEGEITVQVNPRQW